MQEQPLLLQDLARLLKPGTVNNRRLARLDVAGLVLDGRNVEEHRHDRAILADQAALQI